VRCAGRCFLATIHIERAASVDALDVDRGEEDGLIRHPRRTTLTAR